MSTTVSRPLEGQIALVTGASRGIGRGIAIQLGEAGATVYITGRPPGKALDIGLSSLEATKNEISERGGEAILVYCDHGDPNDVKKLFERIQRDTGGTLDILVNSAYSGVLDIMGKIGTKFYDYEGDPEKSWDEINNVGLRNVYVCCTYAARMMVQRRSGLIVNVSSVGGLQYFFSVPYGVGKAAVDRMSTDMAFELKDAGVTVLSLWPGATKTEIVEKEMGEGAISNIAKSAKISQGALEESFRSGETTEFVGKAVVGLATDKNRMQKSGKIQITVELAREYGFSDVGGVIPPNMRSVRSVLSLSGWLRLARLVPGFINIPKPFLHFGSYKF